MTRTRAVRIAIIVAFTLVPGGAEIIRIHVIDGRNGKTMTNEKAQVWINAKKGYALSLAPGADGIAELEAPAGSLIIVQSNLYVDCRQFEKGTTRPPLTYSVDEIRRSGLVAQNTCGKLNVAARPGELLFFVRPIHWWEGMRR
jgi:hypothetical protein